jgi:hypothetical protein
VTNENIPHHSSCRENPAETRRARRGAGRRVPSVRLPARHRTSTGRLGQQFSAGRFYRSRRPAGALEKFLLRLETEKPPRSFIQSLESSWLDAPAFKNFEIRASETGGGKTALVLPDIATCPDCLREIFDPKNRRYRYPFTNCTNCGPRFSIIESLPYDRANTSMKFHDVSAMPGRIRRPARPPVSRAAERLSGLRAAFGILA